MSAMNGLEWLDPAEEEQEETEFEPGMARKELDGLLAQVIPLYAGHGDAGDEDEDDDDDDLFGLEEQSGGRRWRKLICSEAGMATAEYAIATLAAVGFAALLVAILQSGEVREMLMAIIQRALSFG